MPNDARTRHAAAGEYLVPGELLRRDIEAYLAQGPAQSGWDILTRQKDTFRHVQVKTIAWPSQRAVNISPSTIPGEESATDGTRCFDVMVVVLLQKKESHSRFLVLTPADVRVRWAPLKQGRAKRTMTIPKQLGNFSEFEDKWDKIRLPDQ